MNVRELLRAAFTIKLKHIFIILSIFFVLTIILYVSAIKSDAYEAAENFAKTEPEIIKRIGPVSKIQFNFWNGFHMNYSEQNGEASFVFGLKGEKDDAVLDILMKRSIDAWHVETAYISTKNEKSQVGWAPPTIEKTTLP